METENKTEMEGISISEIFRIVRKHIVAILAFFVIGAGAGLYYGNSQDTKNPSYTAYASAICSDQQSSQQSSTTISYANAVALTFVPFFKDNVVLRKASESISANYPQYAVSLTSIKNGLTVSYNEKALYFSFSFTSNDPEKAKTVLDEVLTVTIDLANSLDKDSEPVYPIMYKKLAVLSSAKDNSTTRSSVKMKYTLIGGAIGIVLAALYVFLREIFDTSFRSQAEVESMLKLPVLGVIPTYSFSEEEEANKNDKKGGK